MKNKPPQVSLMMWYISRKELVLLDDFGFMNFSGLRKRKRLRNQNMLYKSLIALNLHGGTQVWLQCPFILLMFVFFWIQDPDATWGVATSSPSQAPPGQLEEVGTPPR